ncbi:MAG: putative metallopeptidase [Nitrosotalea sp.]
MARMKYEPASNDVIELTRRIINTFPERFININHDDIYFTFKDSATSTWRARTGLVSGDMETLTKKKLRLQVWKKDWESSNELQRARTIFHELMHITYDSEKNKYSLVRHELEDWKDAVKLFGVDDENLERVFEPLKEKQAV